MFIEHAAIDTMFESQPWSSEVSPTYDPNQFVFGVERWRSRAATPVGKEGNHTLDKVSAVYSKLANVYLDCWTLRSGRQEQ
ncbi:hypothetical protein E2C01_092570 [Portunus trituberculatus]|uniref:Uncharacterized protein n=1 Tax=Portunus trituberculatus TaxID=210409 RepID=A0A5B7JRR0_PORTR|nr:hypothetical protein [Portunus trituberculatus]